jgi:hypothetical protein
VPPLSWKTAFRRRERKIEIIVFNSPAILAPSDLFASTLQKFVILASDGIHTAAKSLVQAQLNAKAKSIATVVCPKSIDRANGAARKCLQISGRNFVLAGFPGYFHHQFSRFPIGFFPLTGRQEISQPTVPVRIRN